MIVMVTPIERRDLAATYAAGTYAAYERKMADEAAAEEREERDAKILRSFPNHRPQPSSQTPSYCICGAYLERHAEQAAIIAGGR